MHRLRKLGLTTGILLLVASCSTPVPPSNAGALTPVAVGSPLTASATKGVATSRPGATPTHTSSPDPTLAAEMPPTALPAGPARCTQHQIKATPTDWYAHTFPAGDGTMAFDAETDVDLMNSSRTPCRLQGYVGLTFSGFDTLFACGNTGLPCGPTTNRVSTTDAINSPTEAFVVAPGQYESFSIVWLNGYTPSAACTGARWAPPYRTDILLPGDDHPIVLTGSLAIYPCGNKSGQTLIGLTPIGVTGASSTVTF